MAVAKPSAETRACTRWPGVCCPACRGALAERSHELRCRACGKLYPIHGGAPALIDPEASLFDSCSAADGRPAAGGFKTAALRLLPRLSSNPVSAHNYARFVQSLLARCSKPRVLVVGGGREGQGMAGAFAHPRIEWVETDVAPGERAAMLCDAQQIPFEDQTFDGVVAQAVLEHVADPGRAVDEIWRVLKPRGLVYSETPFLQQVHAGACDFTRYTHLGHRRLFRRFDEMDSGAACGPGMALAWAWRGFLQSWFRGRAGRIAATAVAHLTAFWLTWLDRHLCTRPAAFDCASSYYFLGAKSRGELSDRELVRGYRGLQA